MLSLEEVKATLHNPDIPDAELLEIRDQFQALSEIIFEAWQRDRARERAKRQAAKVAALGDSSNLSSPLSK
jgi:hypothetical protein